MNIKKLFAMTLICVGFAAAAQSEVVSQAYEITLSDFLAPTSANSVILFKECDGCDQIHIRVSNATGYSINGKSVRFEDFRKAVAQARDRDRKYVTVLHHLESDAVVSIDVSL